MSCYYRLPAFIQIQPGLLDNDASNRKQPQYYCVYKCVYNYVHFDLILYINKSVHISYSYGYVAYGSTFTAVSSKYIIGI